MNLGKTDVQVNRLGLGLWQWGDQMMWGYGQGYGDADLRAGVEAAFAAGVTFFDTAEVYGRGQSEASFGRCLQDLNRGAVIATKFAPLPWRWRRRDLLRALRGSVARLGVPRVDLYQIHWPTPLGSLDVWAEALADAVAAGLTRAVGVSNYSAAQMRRAHDLLAKRGVPLASNQVEYSLLHREPERNGVQAACRELGITLIAYSPIAKGLVTGKYTAGNPPPGLRGLRASRDYLRRLQPLMAQLKEIGQAHGGKTPAQVALNWLMCQGAVPIPGIKSAGQAQDNVGALGWKLTETEVAALDRASQPLQKQP